MRDQQPANNLLSIASAEWIQALQNFCHHGRVYDGSTANAWLFGYWMPAYLFPTLPSSTVSSSTFLTAVRTYHTEGYAQAG